MRFLGRPAVVLASMAVLVVGMSMFTNVLPFREIVAQRQEISTAAERLETLQEANQALEAHVEALHTPLEIERLAREQLGYVRPGESSFVVIEPEKTAPVSTGEVQVTSRSTEEHKPWYLQLWDFLTGQDLTVTR